MDNFKAFKLIYTLGTLLQSYCSLKAAYQIILYYKFSEKLFNHSMNPKNPSVNLQSIVNNITTFWSSGDVWLSALEKYV